MVDHRPRLKSVECTRRMTFFNGRRDRIDAFRAGDRAVLTEIFHTYGDSVSALVRHGFRLPVQGVVVHGVGADREKDLVQEVFLRAFRPSARVAFNPLLPYRSYLLQIARNALIDEGRRLGAMPAFEASDAELESAPSLEPGPDEELQVRRMRELTVEYCSTLSAELREFVRLRFEVGLSQRDLADQLGVSRRTVRTWEETVHQGLRAFLQARGIGSGGPDSLP